MTQVSPCRLYLVSPTAIDLPAFEIAVREAFSAGDVACLQLRLKHADDAEILTAASHLIPLCHAHDVAFILNDRVDLAAQCGADGVHLGQEDLTTTSIAAARKKLGAEAVIGVTCHASRHLAMEAGEQGADYVAFGAFYPTTSKPAEKLEKWGTPSPEILTWWQEMTEIPCVAIGGITAENAAPLVAAGADFIAVITAVWNHKNGPAAGVAALNAAISR